MGQTVQFYGLQEVMQSHTDFDVPNWGLFDGKRMMLYYEGDDMTESEQLLHGFLKRLESRSIATYTLKFFKDGNITEKRDCDKGSFNFKLTENEEDYYSKRIGSSKSLDQRMSNIEKLLTGDDEPETIGDVLKNPEKTKEYLEVIGMAANLFKGIFGNGTINTAPAYVGNVTRAGDNNMGLKKEYTAGQQERLMRAITTLEKNDPEILLHLEKLAAISENKKPLFQTLIGMLNSM